MRDAARVQAAIDLLTDIVESGRPAEDRLRVWARTNRYAGSKDRARINELVYLVLRRRGELGFAMRGTEPRALVLGALHLCEGRSVDEIAALTHDPSPHSPAGLHAEERALLEKAALPDESAPLDARFNMPAAAMGELERAFGEDLEAELAALQGRAPLDLRVNRLKATRAAVLARFAEEGIAAEAMAHAPDGIRVAGNVRLDAHPLVTEGQVEVQDEGAQLAALACAPEPGQQVVDFCAGAGGKSLTLAAAMQNKGQIYAFDTEPERLKALGPRLARAGVRNVQSAAIGEGDGEEVDAVHALHGRADRVLVDAPCTGSGTWRRTPDRRWTLTGEDIADAADRQRAILGRAAPLVKPGGVLVYVTCSLFPAENTDVIRAFLTEEGAQFEALDWTALWAGMGRVPPPAYVDRIGALMTPARTATDGFYISALRRVPEGSGTA